MRARIDTGLESPDTVAFDFDPREEVLARRGQIVIDALTILAGYRVAGRPAQGGRPYGSFEEWAGVVRDALMWAGLPDIVLSNDTARADDPETAKLDATMAAWIEWELADEYTCARLVELAIEPASAGRDTDQDSPYRRASLRDALLAVAARRSSDNISTERLGRWLVGKLGRVRNGHRFSRRMIRGVMHYRLEGESLDSLRPSLHGGVEIYDMAGGSR